MGTLTDRGTALLGELILAKRRKNNQQSTTDVEVEQLELPIEQQITLSQLENHLWESANILRGPVDAADFKTYIFPLLFFKRISDVYDEEFQQALEESGGISAARRASASVRASRVA
jgi:hypothetical protein